ncbi:phosphatidylinositol-binding protein scs2 [Basidiobolus ranarum]|uniref:Phosphatidylinositol-binding protein scs2 n=1 Tax=Basidiobolus ranarum TaxID=34480 RepID=A0ABR2WN60_9FUNG
MINHISFEDITKIKIPKTSSKLAVDARISISNQYLTKTEVPRLLREKFDFSAPGLRLKGVVIGSLTGGLLLGMRVQKVPQDKNPFQPLAHWIIPKKKLTAAVTAAAKKKRLLILQPLPSVMIGKWRLSPLTAIISAHLTEEFNLSNKATASPADYFLFFLPMNYMSVHDMDDSSYDYDRNGSVDVNNNRSDNMILFHDVMSTYRWEVRFLSFVFGIAEANAFSFYKIWGNDAEVILHSDFKCKLAHSLLLKVKDFECHYEGT